MEDASISFVDILVKTKLNKHVGFSNQCRTDSNLHYDRCCCLAAVIYPLMFLAKILQKAKQR